MQGGFTPLHCAASRGHKDVVELLLNKGANMQAVTKVTLSAGLSTSYVLCLAAQFNFHSKDCNDHDLHSVLQESRIALSTACPK
jgi:ankyrin repeat protein